MGTRLQKGTVHLASKDYLPYYRSVNILSVVIRHMEELGVKAEDLLAGSGIETGDLDDPGVFVTPSQEFKVMRRVVAMMPEPKSGFALGRKYHIGVYNKIGAAVSSCGTLLEAVKILFSCIELTMTYFKYDLFVKGNLAIVKAKELIDLKELQTFIVEREFSAAYRLVCDALQYPVPLIELNFAYPKPAHGSSYGEAFQCPVHFNAPEHMFIFDSKHLAARLPMANPLMKNTYEKECRQLCLRLQVKESVGDQVRHNLFFGPEGLPSITQVARSMGVTERTLRRRLAVEGTSYKAIVAEVLKEKAVNLIRTTAKPIAHIALELGYSNVPSFYRAFFSWTGQKPSHYRKDD
jgi:AraC-like DNA-binding protein